MRETKDARPLDEAKDDTRPGGATSSSLAPSPPAPAQAAVPAPEAKAAVPSAVVQRMRAKPTDEDGAKLRTAEDWATFFGHTNPAPPTGQRPGEAVIPRNRPTTEDFQRWVFLTTAAKAGWGTELPIDEPMTREAYEAAVGDALDLPIGEHHRDLEAEEAEASAKTAQKERAR